jgi:HK97 family phage major capsid protein
MTQLSISAQIELRTKQRELSELSLKPTLTAAEKRQFDTLLSEISLLKSGAISDEVRNAEVDALMREVGLPVQDRSASAKETQNTREYLRTLMRHGKLSDAELRTYAPMDTTTGTPGESGGYFVPQNFYAKVTAMLAAVDPLFDPSIVTYYESDNGNKIPAPLMSDEGVSAVVVSENADGGEQEITLGQLLLDRASTWRSKKIVGTYEWLQDSAFPIDDVIAKLVAVRFRRGIGAANVATLVTQASAAVTPIDCETSGIVTLDDIAALLGNIDSDYVGAPTFRVLMNQTTLTELLKEKDSQDRYQSGVIHFNDEAGCYTIFGKKIAVSPSVDSPASDTSKHPVIAGDMSFWFQRVVKNSLTLLKYQNAPGLAENGLFAFEGFIRANGGLMQLGNSSPIQVLQCIAS